LIFRASQVFFSIVGTAVLLADVLDVMLPMECCLWLPTVEQMGLSSGVDVFVRI